MKKWMKNLKLMAAVSALIALFAVAPVVYGGVTWSGIDPIFEANGHTFNVFVEWPSGSECSITGPIFVEVHNKDASFIGESSKPFACDDSTVTVETDTLFRRIGGPHNFVVTQMRVPASESFPVRLKVYRDGVLEGVCEGQSQESVNCDIVISVR